MVTIGQFRGHNDTAFNATLMASFVHPLQEGELTAGGSLSVGGQYVQWEPLQSFTGSEPATWPDGSYRYAKVWLPQTITAGDLTAVNIENTAAATTPTFALHADVAAGMGTWLDDPELNATPSSGSGGFKITHDLDNSVKTIGNSEQQMNWEVDVDGPLVKRLRGLWRDNGFVVRVFLEFYSGLPYARIWYRGVFSDPTDVNLEKSCSLWRLGFRNCEAIIRRPGWKIGGATSPYGYDVQNMQVLATDTMVGDGQGNALSGFLLFHGGGQPTGDPFDAIRAVNQGSFGEVEFMSRRWRTLGYGPQGIATGRPTWMADDAEAETAAIEQGRRLRNFNGANPWDIYSTVQTREDPPNGGGKNGDSTLPYIGVVETGCPTILSALRIASEMEWWRPMHHHESDASVTRTANHAFYVMFQGRAAGFDVPQHDRFGKPVGSAGNYNASIHGQGGWQPFDRAHYDRQPQDAYAYFTGDPMVLDELDHHREVLLGGLRDETWALSVASASAQFITSLIQERETRGISSIAWIERLLPRADVRNQVTSHLDTYLSETRWGDFGWGGSIEGEFGPAATTLLQYFNNEPRHGLEHTTQSIQLAAITNSSGTHATPQMTLWQRGFFTSAMRNWTAIAPHARFRAVAKRLAYDGVRQAIFDDVGPREDGQGNAVAPLGRKSLIRVIHWYQGQAIPDSYLPPNVAYRTNDSGNVAFTPNAEPLPANTEVDDAGQFSPKTFFQVSADGSEYVHFPVVLGALQIAIEDGDSDIETMCREFITDWFNNDVFRTDGFADPSGSNIQYFLDYPQFFEVLAPGSSAGGGQGQSVTDTSPDGRDVTWNWQETRETGTFADGRPWVVGPITMTSIEPFTQTPRIMSGSMLNPPGATRDQGYDEETYRRQFASGYADLWVPGLCENLQLPKVYSPGDSVVSVVSKDDPTTQGTENNQFWYASVLTVVAEPPADNSFRPPYCAKIAPWTAPRWTVSDLDLSLLPSVFDWSAYMESAPSPVNYTGVLDGIARLWLDHSPGWLGQAIHPEENQHWYGRDMTADLGSAILGLVSDLPQTQKEALATQIVQKGIDNYALLLNGHDWEADGGHQSGRKFPILLAGLLLGDQQMLKVGRDFLTVVPGNGGGVGTLTPFGEDAQTFYVKETSPGVFNFGEGGYELADVDLPDWAVRHYSVPHTNANIEDSKQWDTQLPQVPRDARYRTCCTGNVWIAQVFAALALGLRDDWNHDALFDYQDRFMAQMPNDPYTARIYAAWERSWVAAHAGVWDDFRATVEPDPPPAPPPITAIVLRV